MSVCFSCLSVMLSVCIAVLSMSFFQLESDESKRKREKEKRKEDMCLPTNCLSVFVCVGRLAIDSLFAFPPCLSVFIYFFLRQAWFNLSLCLSVYHLFMNQPERITCVSVCLSPCKSVFSSDCLYVSGHDLNSYIILSVYHSAIDLFVSFPCLSVCLSLSVLCLSTTVLTCCTKCLLYLFSGSVYHISMKYVCLLYVLIVSYCILLVGSVG